jgi:hypothetical protein
MVDENIPSIPALQPRLKARLMVADFTKRHFEYDLDPDKDIYVVWFCKTLQNWKALLSTNMPDGNYYEVTYNGDQGVAYLDQYKKIVNQDYPDEWFGMRL